MNRISQVFRKLAARNSSFAVNFIVRVNFYFRKINNPLIIILTPGKVGSSSVYKSLKREYKSVFHLHNFTVKSVERSISYNLNSNRKYAPLHLIVSKYLLKK